MEIENLSGLFQRNLELAYGCERYLLKELPEVIAEISSASLRTIFEQHLEETATQANRIEDIFIMLHRGPAEETDHAIQNIVGDAQKLIKHIDRSPLLDAALIVRANEVEHHEIAVYGSLRALGDVLGLSGAAELLRRTLAEEKAADRRLTEIAESLVNSEALGFTNNKHGLILM
jgi:ferritin-like metal-binding protein YciE